MNQTERLTELWPVLNGVLSNKYMHPKEMKAYREFKGIMRDLCQNDESTTKDTPVGLLPSVTLTSAQNAENSQINGSHVGTATPQDNSTDE